MGEIDYKTIEVTIGNHKRRYEMRKNYIAGFVIEDKFFHILGTHHSMDRLGEREINKFHLASSVLGLGEKLLSYNNSGKHIIISDEDKDVSCVFTVERYNIVLITVLDKGEMFPSRRHETIVESFRSVG